MIEMAEFMDNDVIYYSHGCRYDLPIKANNSVVRTASPPSFVILDLNSFGPCSHLTGIELHPLRYLFLGM